MIWEIKEWSELSIKEVENIFSLRSEVFIVEQECVYQDIDGKDQKAKHVLGKKNNEIIAYARIFKPGDYFKEASFGRAVVKKPERGKGIGDELVIISIKTLKIGLGRNFNFVLWNVFNGVNNQLTSYSFASF